MWVDCIVVGFAREAESLCLAGIGRRENGKRVEVEDDATI